MTVSDLFEVAEKYRGSLDVYFLYGPTEDLGPHVTAAAGAIVATVNAGIFRSPAEIGCAVEMERRVGVFSALALGDRFEGIEVEYLVEPLVLEEMATSFGARPTKHPHERYLVSRSAVFDEPNPSEVLQIAPGSSSDDHTGGDDRFQFWKRVAGIDIVIL